MSSETASAHILVVIATSVLIKLGSLLGSGDELPCIGS